MRTKTIEPVESVRRRLCRKAAALDSRARERHLAHTRIEWLGKRALCIGDRERVHSTRIEDTFDQHGGQLILQIPNGELKRAEL